MSNGMVRVAASLLVAGLMAGCGADRSAADAAPAVDDTLLGEQSMSVSSWSTQAYNTDQPGYLGSTLRARASFTNNTGARTSRRGGVALVTQNYDKPGTCPNDEWCGPPGNYCLKREGTSDSPKCFVGVASLPNQQLDLDPGASKELEVVATPPNGFYATLSVLAANNTPGYCGSQAAQQDPTKCVRSLSYPLPWDGGGYCWIQTGYTCHPGEEFQCKDYGCDGSCDMYYDCYNNYLY